MVLLSFIGIDVKEIKEKGNNEELEKYIVIYM